MVLLRNSRERLITRAKIEANAEGKAEGKAEGANEMHAKWSAWNVRRIEHERRGEPFDVPPPSPEDCDR
ncbi:MAG: hypothetical protein OXI16_03200 [Chloroflexota bacterium]|nr:hypothetical protein [Chloroflexota bacterium]